MNVTGERAHLWSLVLVAFLGLAACGDDDSTESSAAAKPVAQAPTTDKDAESEEDAVAEYVYNPIGKRDPFRTFIATVTETSGPPPTPLQKYEIDQYKLTGIVWGVERPRALVEDPDGVGHVVELGTYIGKNWGKVTQITSNVVVVTEEYLTPDGALVVNPIEIALKQTGEAVQ